MFQMNKREREVQAWLESERDRLAPEIAKIVERHKVRKLDHYQHSSFVRGWRLKVAKNRFSDECMKWEEGETHELTSPCDGYEVSVRFNKYKDHPEYTSVRSTNYKCEYEPNGIVSTEDARAFYKALKAKGFV